MDRGGGSRALRLWHSMACELPGGGPEQTLGTHVPPCCPVKFRCVLQLDMCLHLCEHMSMPGFWEHRLFHLA